MFFPTHEFASLGNAATQKNVGLDIFSHALLLESPFARTNLPLTFGWTYDTTFTVAPNSLFSKEMTHILNELETKPANTVLTSGFEITSDFPIIVVYDFLSSSNNPETYSLKGQNGIGYEFVAPFQTKWRNQNVTPINPKQQNFNIETLFSRM